MRAPLALALAGIALAPAALTQAALAQGAIEETPEDLGAALRRPATRGLLPPAADVSATLPPPRDQGAAHSCTSWATAYAAGTQALRRRLPATPPLSPSFTYNQVSADMTCQRGTTIGATLDLLRDVGALPVSAFAYDSGWCGRLPSAAERAEAAGYRIAGWHAFRAADPGGVKAEIADGRPVIVSVPITGGFQAFRGDGVIGRDALPGEAPPASGAPPRAASKTHAVLAVGYDDARQAFRIQNSWGRSWGEGGLAWVSYEYWRGAVRVGYVID